MIRRRSLPIVLPSTSPTATAASAGISAAAGPNSPHSVRRRLVAGDDRNPQFPLQRFDSLDGSPVGAGEKNAIRGTSFHLGRHKADDFRWWNSADIEVPPNAHANSLYRRITGFPERGFDAVRQIFRVRREYRDLARVNRAHLR